MNTEIVRVEGNDYGYATITRCDDGTWTVDRCTNKPVKALGCSITLQDQRTGLTEAEARELAATWAAKTAPKPVRRRTQYCHFCGLPLRRGYCPECGDQDPGNISAWM